jgi:hypothetical protein
VPGIGPITALCFKATIDDPNRNGGSFRLASPTQNLVHIAGTTTEMGA